MSEISSADKSKDSLPGAPAAKPAKSFPRTAIVLSVIALSVSIAGYLITRRNSELTFLQHAQNRETLLRINGNGLEVTNAEIKVDRLNFTLPRSTVVGVGHSISSDIGDFPHNQLIAMLTPRLLQIAERSTDYKGCLIDAPVLVTFIGARKGESRRFAQIYVARISGDKLTGAWRFFIGEILHYETIKASSSPEAEERYLEALLPKMQVMRSRVTTDGTIP